MLQESMAVPIRNKVYKMMIEGKKKADLNATASVCLHSMYSQDIALVTLSVLNGMYATLWNR
jgi:hypothetical protein